MFKITTKSNETFRKLAFGRSDDAIADNGHITVSPNQTIRNLVIRNSNNNISVGNGTSIGTLDISGSNNEIIIAPGFNVSSLVAGGFNNVVWIPAGTVLPTSSGTGSNFTVSTYTPK